MKKKSFQLLKMHMDADPMYIFGHAIVAGKLASKEITTFEEYKKACSSQGINCYSGAWEDFAIEIGYTKPVEA